MDSWSGGTDPKIRGIEDFQSDGTDQRIKDCRAGDPGTDSERFGIFDFFLEKITSPNRT